MRTRHYDQDFRSLVIIKCSWMIIFSSKLKDKLIKLDPANNPKDIIDSISIYCIITRNDWKIEI